MMRTLSKYLMPALGNGAITLLVILVAFGCLSRQFLEPGNLLNIFTQTSSLAIVAAGMTCTLLTAGIDLSVGSCMFLAAAVAGKILLSGLPLTVAIGAALSVGLAFGFLNAILVAYLSMQPFIATLATLFVGRGLALLITDTRSLNLPEGDTQFWSRQLFFIPLPVLVMLLVLVSVHLILSYTPFGRQIYAIGYSALSARKAGVDTTFILAATYVICGVCAAIGGLVSLMLLGTVSQTFGAQREFAAVSAAVLGGVSLFGGRGKVLPGALIGSLLIQTVENGLVIINANPYVYPLVTGMVIFSTVMIDSLRHERLLKASRRTIRIEEAPRAS
jgi:ribose transport system permease protein